MLKESKMAKLHANVQDLPEGYRLTELGPLPEAWRVVQLRDIAVRSFGGGTPSTQHPEYWDGSIPWTTSAVIGEGDIYLTRFQRAITEEGLAQSSAKVAKKGSFIVGTRVGVGKAVVADFDIAINQDLTAIELNTSAVLPEFLAFKLSRIQEWFENNKRGATIKGVPREDLLGLQLPLPPLPEQRAIAHVLRAVQEAKEATERVIAAARELKKSLMRHLFTYGPVPVDQADRVPIQETDIGPLPAHWRVVRLGEVADKPQYGYTASATQYPVGPKFLRITDIQNDCVHWASVPFCAIQEDLLEKYRLKEGDILFARIGATTGKTYLVTEPPHAVFASYLIRIRTSSAELTPTYLYHFTHTSQYWQQINAAKGGRLKQGINIPILTSLGLPLPPLNEQRQIARMLQVVDEKIRAEEGRKQALEALFKTLLHHLMTARRRLPKTFVQFFKGGEI